ncbi:unnamed protein product [Amoebophrya sp. A25]|nr:unnamed protein product [Amoebophrya sp. A25]|eukprot:GSA25T00024240001.1
MSALMRRLLVAACATLAQPDAISHFSSLTVSSSPLIFAVAAESKSTSSSETKKKKSSKSFEDKEGASSSSSKAKSTPEQQFWSSTPFLIASFVLSTGIFAVFIVSNGLAGGAGRHTVKADAHVALFGACNSGKTSLFFLLRDDERDVPLVSSLKPSRDVINFKRTSPLAPASPIKTTRVATSEEQHQDAEQDEAGPSSPVELLDCPGHPMMRMGNRNAVISMLKANTGKKSKTGILYLVDGSDKAELKNAAEHLYDLFTDTEFVKADPALLLTINKTDKMQRTEKMVVDEIEREIERMRASRSHALENDDAADQYLGVEGERFSIKKHAPLSTVETCAVSVKLNKIDPVRNFVANLLD